MNELNYSKLNGLIPCIIQDDTTDKVLMLGFMNNEAFEKTISEKKVTFYSRTKNRLWTKGESSGNFLHVKDIITDCDKDTLLIKVSPEGPVCHMGADTCFNEVSSSFTLSRLERIINDRKSNPSDESYTSSLLKQGINKIAQKVGEEAIELIIEAKNDDQDRFLNEAADLMYHFLVLLQAKNVSLANVEAILESRHHPR